MTKYAPLKLVILAAFTFIAGPASAGTLFIGTDENTFDGILPDKLGVATVNGSTLVSQTNYATTFHINGFTDVSGRKLPLRWRPL